MPGGSECNGLIAASDDHHSRVVLFRYTLLPCNHCNRTYRHALAATVFSVLKRSSLHRFVVPTVMNFYCRNFLDGTNGYAWQSALLLES